MELNTCRRGERRFLLHPASFGRIRLRRTTSQAQDGIEEQTGGRGIRGNFLGFTAKATMPIAACYLAAVLAGVAREGNKRPQLTGQWEFNADHNRRCRNR